MFFSVELIKMESPTKAKDKRKEWTWKQQTDVIKWQNSPIDGPLMKLEEPELAVLAIECFDCILRYSGDLPLTPEMSEVKCVYTVLMVRKLSMFIYSMNVSFFVALSQICSLAGRSLLPANEADNK